MGESTARVIARGTICDQTDCTTRIADEGDAYQLLPPGVRTTLNLGARVYCSANCAKRALIQEDETDERC